MRKWPLLLVLLLAGCDSDSDPSDPSPVVPSPTPTPAPTPTPSASSPYAGNWVYRTTLLAVDSNCGHTPGDVGMVEGPFAVTIASDGRFTLPGGNTGSISSIGNVSIALAAGTNNCSGTGTGAGGCRDTDHCDGTSQQSGDVKKWTLFRQ